MLLIFNIEIANMHPAHTTTFFLLIKKAPVHMYTDDRTVEYTLGGTMALVIVTGVFLGWVCSYYYWAIRNPRLVMP